MVQHGSHALTSPPRPRLGDVDIAGIVAMALCLTFGTTIASFIAALTTFHHITHIMGTLMKLESLQDLFVDELKDLYSAENQLLKALPKMAKAASSKDLKAGFEKHLKQTEGHVDRLEKIFGQLDASPKGKKCKAMEGLIEEGSEVIDEDAEDEVKDAALIAAAQRVEHYEIAGYGCVRTYAELLGNTAAAKLLQQTLNEEGDTDKALTKLAESINVQAEDPSDEEDQDEAPKRSNRKKLVKR